ncbi:hypothetical protein MTBUT4_30225 [Magnetospirillum sp. UT-4]|nr:hypothetical protein MTBUT4_30225 [Magnetospirillum sp. UT-4]
MRRATPERRRLRRLLRVRPE